MFESLRSRDFALLWSGQSVSMIGDGVFTVSLALEALHIDHSAHTLSFVLAARTAPMVVLLPFAGVIVDRMQRKRLMLISDLVRGIAVGLLCYLTVTHRVGFSSLILLSVVFGLADAFFYPASNAIVPELLPVEHLASGNGLFSAAQSASEQLIGPALGGVVASLFSVAVGFGFDAATFFISATCLWLIDLKTTSGVRSRVMEELRGGLRYGFSQRWFWVTAIVAGLANAVGFAPVAVLDPLMVKQVFGGGSLDVGLVIAAGGAGGVLGALSVSRLGSPKRDVTAMWLGWASAGILQLLASAAPNIVLFAIAGFVQVGLLVYGVALWTPLMQRMVPNHLLGRVSSIDWMISLGFAPLGILFAGILANLIGVRQALAVGGGVSLLSFLVIFVPGVRDPELGRG